jgi:DNA-binding Lrp family transcriptional regulator
MSQSTVNEAGNDGGSVTVALPKISEREMKALNALAGTGEEYYLNFKAIARRSGLDPSHVRRSVRALARKGLAEYRSGLWTEDGEMAGAGYRATAVGRCAATKPIEEDYYE